MRALLQVLSIQKTGVLFETPKLKNLSTALSNLRADYQREQLSIISQALRTALKYSEDLKVVDPHNNAKPFC